MTDGKTGRVYNRCEVYGISQEHVIDCLKASPYWKAAGLDEKVRFVLGGWAYPCWKTLELFNNVATGDMLNVETRTAPTLDLPAHKRRKALADVPLVSCYATRNKDRLCVFVLSRKIDNYPLAGDDGFTPVSVELPIQEAKSVTLFRMIGDPRSHNLDSEQVKIERLALNPAMAGSPLVVNDKTGADARGLPPGATLLYVFDGIE